MPLVQDTEREIGSLTEAVALIDEWVAAYNELRCEHLRLQLRLEHFKFAAEFRADLLEKLDPYLPENMQDPALRAKHPKVYAAIAEFLEVPDMEFVADDAEDPFGV